MLADATLRLPPSRSLLDHSAQPSSIGPSDLPLEVRRLLVARDEGALATFFDHYFNRVYGYVRRLVGEDHLAEDLTQDVFLQLHRSLASYDPTRQLRPWVFAIATNKVRDHWRSRAHRDAQQAVSVERDGAGLDVEAGEAPPEAGLVLAEAGVELREAVEQLTEGLRATLLLRVYEELSFAEIAAALDCNEATARKRYSRALEKLREGLGVSENASGTATGGNGA